MLRSSILCVTKLAQQMGTAVPGPFVIIKSGITLAISTYECKTAQLFFEHDRELQGFELDCLEDGSFDEPDAWFKCVSS